MQHDASIDKSDPRHPLPTLSKTVLSTAVAAKILLHIPGLFRYGYFRDELYFLNCAHQTHSMWGPGDFDGDQLIWLQWEPEWLEGRCGTVEVVGAHHHPWGMAEENRPILICRDLVRPLAKQWPELTHWN